MTARAEFRPSEPELSELVACTLTDSGLKTQQERWTTLCENFGISRIVTDDGLGLTFRHHPQVAAELHALVEVENACCGWASWAVERDADGSLVMAARSQADGVATLHSMFIQAGPWRDG